VGTPGVAHFGFAYYCGSFYVNSETHSYGPFTFTNLSAISLPTTLLNTETSSLYMLNVGINGVKLYNFNYVAGTHSVTVLTNNVNPTATLGSKISEDICLFAVPSTTGGTSLTVYEISSNTNLQFYNSNYENPIGLFPFQVNKQSNTPIAWFILAYGSVSAFPKLVAISSIGQNVPLSNGEFLELVNLNTVMINQQTPPGSNWMNYANYEVEGSGIIKKSEKKSLLRRIISEINQ